MQHINEPYYGRTVPSHRRAKDQTTKRVHLPEDLNYWTKLSIEYANQRSYLDDLFKVYPAIPSGIREINEHVWSRVEDAFNENNKSEVIRNLLKLDLFPIKDSYVAFLKRDNSAIERNPQTIDRLWGTLCEMGLSTIYEKCSQPKEANRQIGPMFKNWVKKGYLGAPIVNLKDFTGMNGDAILDASDAEMENFAREHLNYTREKGLDFLARFNGKFILGEAKFLTDNGGHQNAQFNDAIDTILCDDVNEDVVKVAILDGVLYIPGNNKMYKNITTNYKSFNILSSLVLREFLYSI